MGKYEFRALAGRFYFPQNNRRIGNSKQQIFPYFFKAKVLLLLFFKEKKGKGAFLQRKAQKRLFFSSGFVNIEENSYLSCLILKK